MTSTPENDPVLVSLDVGKSTGKFLAYKVTKHGSGRPRVMYICRKHSCGFYSNRLFNMQEHYAKTHGVTIKSSSDTANTSNDEYFEEIRTRLCRHLQNKKPSPEELSSGYLATEQGTVVVTEPVVVPIPLSVIDNISASLSKLNLSFDQDELPGVIQTINLKVYEIMDGNISEFNPTIGGKCPHHLPGERCMISKEGSTERRRCFDIDSPFILAVSNYGCSVHNSRFSLLNCLTADCYSFPSLVVLPHTIITRPFLNHIFNLAPGHYFNFSKMLTTVQTTWMSNFEARLQRVVALKVKTEAEGSLYFLAHDEFKSTIKQQNLNLCQKTGGVLRIDHTYKVVKHLSAYSPDDKTRVQIKASLFTVLNEKGQVLKSKIVPTDERVHVSSVLKKIWDTEGREAITTHVFTDNSVTDKNTVKSTWRESAHKSHPSPSVNQDLWHALHRIDQVMNHKHPDYHKARKQLSDTLNEATEPKVLKKQLFAWCTSFEVLQSSSVDSAIKRLAAKFAVSRAHRKKKILQNHTIEVQHQSPIIDSRVRHALANLANNYAEDILPSSSLPEGIKQGTSANEAWHKYLSKNFVQDSGSISIELAKAVISHLQYLFNNSIETRNDYDPITGYISLSISPIRAKTIHMKHMSVVQIEERGFRLKQMNWLRPRIPDIELCKKYLAEINSEQHGLGISLLWYLSHYKFQNSYSKGYVKKLLTELEK